MIILGVDPALNSPGVGVFQDDTLVAAANVKIAKTAAELEPAERVRFVARAIVQWFADFAVTLPEHIRPFTVVYERMQIYGAAASEGDPNDLIPLAEVGAAVAFKLEPEHVVCVTPRVWSAGTSKRIKVGNRRKLPKSIWESSRGRRVKMILRPEELALIPDQHDALDGVCLAMHATPRALATPRRVYPGASPPRTAPR